MNRYTTQTVLALLLAASLSQSARAEYAELTPDWAKQNPGKLTLSVGSAMGGWNGYSFKLHFDSPKTFSVSGTVLLDRESEKGKLALHTFSWSVSTPTKTLPINLQTPSYTPPFEADKAFVRRADANVSIIVRHLDSQGEPTGITDEYDLTLSDFKDAWPIPDPRESNSQVKPETVDVARSFVETNPVAQSSDSRFAGKFLVISHEGMHHGVSQNARFESVGQHDCIVIAAQHPAIEHPYDYWIPLDDVIDIKVFDCREDAVAFDKANSPVEDRPAARGQDPFGGADPFGQPGED